MSEKKPGNPDAIVHVYDGIEEQDHPIPLWFNILFYGTILFGGVYYYHYELGEGRSIQQEYAAAHQSDDFRARAEKRNAPGVDEDSLLALVQDPKQVSGGHQVFASKCASCHGVEGQGGIGPNLTDRYWIHGGKMTEIHGVVANGVLDKGMPPWGAVLAPAELNQVVAFIRSIRGTNPPNPKAPQGEEVKD